MDIQVHLF